MIVSELIKALETMPQDKKVFHLWDGEPRTEINLVWLSRDGRVITSDFEMKCYDVEVRPKFSSKEERWETRGLI